MRRLVRVAAATAPLLALLTLLGPPAPTRAESAADCYATLNAYRARAGLASATSTSTVGKPLARAALNHARYRVNVDPGDAPQLRQQGLPDLGPFGPDANAHLETSSLRQLGFTGVNPWDRTKAAGLAANTWRYQYEDVTTATGIPAARLQGVRSWIDAPYHRLPLLDANTRHVGCAVAERVVGGRVYSAEVLEMAATWKDVTKRITVYPAPRQTGVPASFNRCQESPTPFGGPCAASQPVQNVGYVLTVQADGYYAMRVSDLRLTRGSTAVPVDSHRAVHSKASNSAMASAVIDITLPRNAAMLAAKAPLLPRNTYTARVSGEVQATKGGAWAKFATKTWSFATA